jgi:hypothetical protein
VYVCVCACARVCMCVCVYMIVRMYIVCDCTCMHSQVYDIAYYIVTSVYFTNLRDGYSLMHVSC